MPSNTELGFIWVLFLLILGAAACAEFIADIFLSPLEGIDIF
jgi:hypothetical protein